MTQAKKSSYKNESIISNANYNNENNNRNYINHRSLQSHNSFLRVSRNSNLEMNALIRNEIYDSGIYREITQINTTNARNVSNTYLESFLQSKNDSRFNFTELGNGLNILIEKIETYVGQGLKRMKGYISNISLDDVQRKRVEFWGKYYNNIFVI